MTNRKKDLWSKVAKAIMGFLTALFIAIFLLELFTLFNIEPFKEWFNQAMIIGSAMWLIAVLALVFAGPKKWPELEKPKNFWETKLFGTILLAVSSSGIFLEEFKVYAMVVNTIISFLFLVAIVQLQIKKDEINKF